MKIHNVTSNVVEITDILPRKDSGGNRPIGGFKIAAGGTESLFNEEAEQSAVLLDLLTRGLLVKVDDSEPSSGTAVAEKFGIATLDSTGASGGSVMKADGSGGVVFGDVAQVNVTGLGASLSGKVDTTDPRLTDSRNPLAHASSHGFGQSDAISIHRSQVLDLINERVSKFNLKSWWKFISDSLDFSVSEGGPGPASVLTLYGSPTVSSGLVLDGATQYGDTPRAGFDASIDFTLEWWENPVLKTQTGFGGNIIENVMDYMDFPAPTFQGIGFRVVWSDPSAHVTLQIWLGNGTNTTTFSASPGAFFGAWNHYAVTKGSWGGNAAAELNWYKNGVKFHSDTATLDPTFSTNVVPTIGRSARVAVTDEFFKGTIKDLRFYPVALGPETIAQNYMAGRSVI